MSEQLTAIIEEAIRARQPDAREIQLIETATAGEARTSTVRSLRVSWEHDGVTHLDQFVVKEDVGLEENGGESRLLRSLEETQLRTPGVVWTGSAGSQSLFLMEHLHGIPMSELVQAAGMRWELTSLGFSFARLLAQVHALEWNIVAPWMGDAEALPEDMIDDQTDAAWADWEERIPRMPDSARTVFERALAWLDLRRPVEVSVCLCHGDYAMTNVLAEDADEVTGVVDWDLARVTDASYDLALLPFQVHQLGLPGEDAELFSQAVFGSYLQSSPRSLGNLPFYTVARLLSEALDAFEQQETGDACPRSDIADMLWDHPQEWLIAIERAMRGGGQVPWRV